MFSNFGLNNLLLHSTAVKDLKVLEMGQLGKPVQDLHKTFPAEKVKFHEGDL